MTTQITALLALGSVTTCIIAKWILSLRILRLQTTVQEAQGMYREHCRELAKVLVRRRYMEGELRRNKTLLNRSRRNVEELRKQLKAQLEEVRSQSEAQENQKALLKLK